MGRIWWEPRRAPDLERSDAPAAPGYWLGRERPGDLRLLGGGRCDRLDDLRREDAIAVDEDLEGHAGGLGIRWRQRSAGDRVDEVTDGPKGQRDAPVHLRE